MKKFIGGIVFTVSVAAFGKLMYELGKTKMGLDILKMVDECRNQIKDIEL